MILVWLQWILWRWLAAIPGERERSALLAPSMGTAAQSSRPAANCLGSPPGVDPNSPGHVVFPSVLGPPFCHPIRMAACHIRGRPN